MGESGKKDSSTKVPVFRYRMITSLGISSREASARFNRLQEKLVPLWKTISSLNPEEQTIVVIPSMSMPGRLGTMTQAYEERFLFLILLLRQPRARLIYVTSEPVNPHIIDYYLGLLPGTISGHARQRLEMMSIGEASDRPLSEKLLERPRFLQRIRSLIRDPNRAHLVPFNTTILERDLALRLGIPMFGADPKFFHLGSKSGCRRLFAEEGVPHPAGHENLTTMGQVVEAICSIRARKPHVSKVIVKLNEGVSGEGNATVDLKGLPDPGSPMELDAVAAKLRRMQLEATDIRFKTYVEKMAHGGGIVEEMIQGEEVRSPSVQMRVTPLGELEILSTYDQLLGGRGGQSFLGARFPADSTYSIAISREAKKIGQRLAKEGVIGRFAVDFLVVRSSDGSWDPYAIELNLRKGGTTHPFLTLQFLTDGSYDAEEGVFRTPSGATKCLIANDHVESPYYKALSAEDILDISVRHNLHFNQNTQTGVVFHMMRGLPEHGRMGLTAISNSHEEARELYDRTFAALNQEAEAAIIDPGLPDF